jgi:hypothetical protein
MARQAATITRKAPRSGRVHGQYLSFTDGRGRSTPAPGSASTGPCRSRWTRRVRTVTTRVRRLIRVPSQQRCVVVWISRSCERDRSSLRTSSTLICCWPWMKTTARRCLKRQPRSTTGKSGCCSSTRRSERRAAYPTPITGAVPASSGYSTWLKSPWTDCSTSLSDSAQRKPGVLPGTTPEQPGIRRPGLHPDARHPGSSIRCEWSRCSQLRVARAPRRGVAREQALAPAWLPLTLPLPAPGLVLVLVLVLVPWAAVSVLAAIRIPPGQLLLDGLYR